MAWSQIVQVAFKAGIAVDCALVLSLLLRRTNSSANRLLCVHILSMAYVQTINYLDYTRAIENYPYLVRTPFAMALWIIWSLHEYVIALTTPDYRLNRKSFYHLIPALVATLWCAIDIYLRRPSGPALSREFFEDRAFHGVIVLALFGIYICLTISQLKRYRETLPSLFSDLTRVRLSWLSVLIACCAALWAVGTADLLMGPSVALWNVMIPTMSLGTFALAVFTLRQSAVFAWGDGSAEIQAEKKKTAVKQNFYSPEDLARETTRLNVFLQKEKPYLNPELRLSELASALDLRPYQLTEIINRGEGKNFYELVNGYRVEEFKQRAKDPKFSHLSLLGLALDSGFNSKSVFNDTFRKMTGQTPSEFRSSEPPASTSPI